MRSSDSGGREAVEGPTRRPIDPVVDDPYTGLPALLFRRRPEPPHAFEAITGSCQEIAGSPPEALLGDAVAWWERVPQEDRERVFAAILDARERSASYCIVYPHATPAGSPRWLREEARPVVDGDGAVLGFAGVVVDVSEEQAVLQELRERERERERLEEQLAFETRIAELSRHFLALSTEEIDGGIRQSLAVVGALAEADRSWLFSFGGASRGISAFYEWCAEGVEPYGERVRDASRQRFTWAYRSLGVGDVLHIPDASKLPDEAAVEREEMLRRDVESMLGIPLHFGGRLVGYLGFETIKRAKTWSGEAITILRLVAEILMNALRRKRAEQDLGESQLRLHQAQKMEAVGTLAGGIAHDFNNQLTVMLGNARYVQARMGEDAKLREAMVDLTRSAEHCAQLTRSLLAFSRRSSVSTTLLDVASVVSETRELIRPLVPSSTAIEVSLGEVGQTVLADPIQLQQVLVNVVVNARDAMPDGGKIVIATSNRQIGEDEAGRLGLPRPGDYVEIVVRDDGTGMDEQTRLRVFEPFFTTKVVGEGTGLGLATAYGIVKESRGAIDVESALGRGTTVRVLLPRAAARAAEREEWPAAAILAGSGTILLVEDQDSVRRFVARALAECGYDVIEAESGDEGLRLGERRIGAIAALVTDLEMPGLGGLDLIHQLRVARPGLPVVVLSGYAREHVTDDDQILAGVRFLQKPFSEETLLAEVRQVLQDAQAS